MAKTKPVEAFLIAGMCIECLEFRTKDDIIFIYRIKEWLDASPIPSKEKTSLADIPQGKGKHTDKPLQRQFDAPTVNSVENNFRIRIPLKLVAHRLQVQPNFPVVINLAIENNAQRFIRRPHRLMSGRRKINNRETTMAKTDISLTENAFIVGPTVDNSIYHALHVDSINRLCETEFPSDTTHNQPLR